MEEDENSEPLDPRIQQELERLNKASILINKLENDLDDARAKFRCLLTESTQQLESLNKKLGSCIEKAKVYYDCRLKAKEMQLQTQQAATRYERAMSMQAAAREMVELAEQGYESKRPSFDMAWQEMLNHATIKVMDAENERLIREVEHGKMMQQYTQVQEEVNHQYKEHKRSIIKSKVYYETKGNFHTSLDTQKLEIGRLQTDVDAAKKLYAKALHNLEGISEDIHRRRQQTAESFKLGERQAGVGSESPVPPPQDKKRISDVYNNNTENEIIISYPPSASCRNSSSVRNSRRRTINSDAPDTPIDISGIHLAVRVSQTEAPLIVVDNVSTSGKDSECITPSNQHEEKIVPTNQILTNNSSVNQNVIECQRNTLDLTDVHSAAGSIETSPVAMRHRRIHSGSIKLSAKMLLHETSSIDSDSGSVCSFVGLDDNGVANAMKDGYFSGSFDEELRKSVHEDYSKLPQSLAEYQKPYESARQSITCFPLLNEAGMKLDQVLKILEITDDESIV